MKPVSSLTLAAQLLALLLTGLGLANAGHAQSTLTLHNLDSTGEGFNDPLETTAVGANHGETLGEQREIAFRFALDLVETIVNSPIDIGVNGRFSSLSCSPTATLLASASIGSYHLNFSGAPLTGTVYAQALANSLAGSDLNPGGNDLTISLNSEIDNNCLPGVSWYYGLDGNASAMQVDFVTLILHEIIHGLGFSSTVSPTTGALTAGANDAYILNLEDHSLGMTWGNMSNAQRATSATDDPDLHWIGSNVQVESTILSAGLDQGHVRMHAPAGVATFSSVSHFSDDLTPDQIMEPFIGPGLDSTGLARPLLEDIGWSIAASSSPIASEVPSLLLKNTQPGQFDIAVMDDDTASGSLSVNAVSLDQAIIADANISVSGGGRLWQVNFTAEPAADGVTTIAVTVSDGVLQTVRAVSVDIRHDLPPVLTIDTPADGALLLTMPTTFTTTALDFEDGDISGLVSWSGSSSGTLGTGASIAPVLPDGSETITATVTDSGGNIASMNIDIQVSQNGDEDSDGLTNALEVAMGLDPFDADSDDDFLNDFDEVNRDGDPTSYTPGVDTDPLDPDTDGDGLLDGIDLQPLQFNAEENTPMISGLFYLPLALLLLLSARRYAPHR